MTPDRPFLLRHIFIGAHPIELETECCWDVFHGTVVLVSQCGDSRLPSSLLLCLLLVRGSRNMTDIVRA